MNVCPMSTRRLVALWTLLWSLWVSTSKFLSMLKLIPCCHVYYVTRNRNHYCFYYSHFSSNTVTAATITTSVTTTTTPLLLPLLLVLSLPLIQLLSTEGAGRNVMHGRV